MGKKTASAASPKDPVKELLAKIDALFKEVEKKLDVMEGKYGKGKS